MAGWNSWVIQEKKRRMMKVELYNNGQFWYRVGVWIFAPWHGRALPMVAPWVWIRWPWPGRSRVDPLVMSRMMCPWMGPWGSSLGWHCGQGSGTAGRGPAQHPGLFPPSLRVFRLVVRALLARRIPGWICLGSQPRLILVCWSVQHHQRVGVSSFGPHCPPHHSGFRVDVSARGTARQKIGDLVKTSVLWGKKVCGKE